MVAVKPFTLNRISPCFLINPNLNLNLAAPSLLVIIDDGVTIEPNPCAEALTFIPETGMPNRSKTVTVASLSLRELPEVKGVAINCVIATGVGVGETSGVGDGVDGGGGVGVGVNDEGSMLSKITDTLGRENCVAYIRFVSGFTLIPTAPEPK